MRRTGGYESFEFAGVGMGSSCVIGNFRKTERVLKRGPAPKFCGEFDRALFVDGDDAVVNFQSAVCPFHGDLGNRTSWRLPSDSGICGPSGATEMKLSADVAHP